MPALAALTLLLATQETVAFRTAPPLDRPLTFSLAVQSERPDGTPLLDARLVVVQRARAEGGNFRLSRYVSFVAAEGTGPMEGSAKQAVGLSGRTFPLLIGPDGQTLRLERKKYENDPTDMPSFAFPFAGPLAVGTETRLDNDLLPKCRATLHEVRDLGGVRAAVFAVIPDEPSNVAAPSGTLVASPDDGLILLMDLRNDEPANGGTPGLRLRFTIRRQNVPGLDRLAAELRMKD